MFIGSGWNPIGIVKESDRIHYSEACTPLEFNGITYSCYISYNDMRIWLKENNIYFTEYSWICWRNVPGTDYQDHKLEWSGTAGYVIYDLVDFMGVKLRWDVDE